MVKAGAFTSKTRRRGTACSVRSMLVVRSPAPSWSTAKPWRCGENRREPTGVFLRDVESLYPETPLGTDPVVLGRLDYRGDGVVVE